jgi:hypothetical protein
MQVIPRGTATDALATIPFSLVDATDLITPEDITVTGVKANLSFGGAADAPSANDIVKVDGAAGEYAIVLDATERNNAIGTVVRGWLQPSGCALTKFTAQIGAAGVVNEPVTTEAIIAGQIAALDGFTSTDTALELGGVAHTITRNDTDGYITAITAD